MKKYIFIFLILLLIPTLAFSQAWRDGRWMNDGSISSDKLVDGTVANAKLSSTAVDGGVMLEATSLIGWFPVEGDSADTDQGDGPWAIDASNPPTLSWWGDKWPVYGFDADAGSSGDDIVYLEFTIPADYEAGTLELYMYWFLTEKAASITDTVVWDASVHVIGNADSLVQTDSSLTAVSGAATAADSNMYITNFDPETSGIVYTAADLVRFKIWVDESECVGDDIAYLRGIRVECERKDE